MDLIERQDAIDAVYKCDDIFAGDMPVMVVKADAYEALAQLPSAQPEPCEDTISRQAVIEINRSYHGQMPNEVNHRIWKEINELPSAQPEVLACGEGELIAQPEIVRCKDCMYWVAHDKRCVYLNHGFAPNMWCCHGRRADG